MSKIVPNNYVSCHAHSCYSRMDSISKVEDLVSKASRLGMNAMALTDHGVIGGWIKFYDECKKKNIKPIFGMEAYVCDDATLVSRTDKELEILEEKKKTYMPLWDGIENNPNEKIEELKGLKTTTRKSNHLILLAKNKVGYHNIMKLSSMAYLEGFYYKPRVDLKMLAEYHDGIMASSACLGGQITSQILKGDIPKAEEYLRQYVEIFKDDFYLELQLHPVKEQIVANKGLLELAKKFNVKTIIAQDHHYTEADDVFLHEVVIRLKNGQKEAMVTKPSDDLPSPVQISKESKSIGGRMGFMYKNLMEEKVLEKKQEDDSDGYFYNAREYWFKSFDELKDSWKKHHEYISEEVFNECINNTLLIADKVEAINPYSSEVYLPKFDCGDLTPKEFLLKLIKDGATERLKHKYANNLELKKKYDLRLKEEFAIITDLGFQEYFLIVWDLVHWCANNNIYTGDGRGSVGACLIAYCLGITNVDPIESGDLIFSRFINKTRSSPKFNLTIKEYTLEKK